MRVELFKDKIGFVSSVDNMDRANDDEANRIKYVTELAAISRGNHKSNNPATRYKQLLKEAAPVTKRTGDLSDSKSPSRPLEFLPVIVRVKFANVLLLSSTDLFVTICGIPFTLEDFNNFLGGSMGYLRDDKLYTNMRALLNAGIPYEEIPYSNSGDDYSSFKAVRLNTPMFVFNHLITHTALSKEARSERMVDISDVDYWLPVNFREKLYEAVAGGNKAVEYLLEFNNRDLLVKALLTDFSQVGIQNLFKGLGFNKEIYQRAMLEFRYKEFVIVGWDLDPKKFKHLIIERSAAPELYENWTQESTRETVAAIRTVLKV